MHTTVTKNMRFHHNGDFSGDVQLVIKDGWKNDFDRERIEHENFPDGGFTFVHVPFEDLRELVLEYLRRQMINNIEDMDDDELIKRVIFGKIDFD